MKNNIFAQLLLQSIPFIITGFVAVWLLNIGISERFLEQVGTTVFTLSTIFVSVIFYKIINFDIKIGLKEVVQVAIAIFLLSSFLNFYINLSNNDRLNFAGAFEMTVRTFVFPILIILTVLSIGIGTYFILKKIAAISMKHF